MIFDVPVVAEKAIGVGVGVREGIGVVVAVGVTVAVGGSSEAEAGNSKLNKHANTREPSSRADSKPSICQRGIN